METPSVQCPASMCPLIAPNGSPWTGKKGSTCPQHDDLEKGGCAWWSMTCSTGGIHAEVDTVLEAEGRAFVIGPNQPKPGISTPKTYQCKNENICSWQLNAAARGTLCPPRYALSKGLDPRVCLF